MRHLNHLVPDELLVGAATGDDAAVWKLDDDRAAEAHERLTSARQRVEPEIDLAAVIETLLNDNSDLTITGPEHLLSLLEPHLAKLPGPAWTLAKAEGPEIVIASGDARIETCLEEWLRQLEGDVG